MAGTEHGDLAFQHLVKPPDGNLRLAFEPDKVVGVIEAVGPAVRVDGAVQPLQCRIEELNQMLAVSRVLRSENPCL